MESLPIADLAKLNQSIQQLYTTHNFARFGTEALTVVDRLVPGEVPMFHVTHLPSAKMEYGFLGDFDLTPEMLMAMYQNFDTHPILQNMPQTLTGAYKISDFISQKELHSLEGLYQQFLKAVNLEEQMVMFLPSTNQGSWSKLSQAETSLVGFSLNRYQRNFTERDRTILNLLRPHLAQAYTNAQQYQELQQEHHQLQQSLNHLGVVMLDHQHQIKSIAPQAIIWLEIYFDRTTCSSQLPDHLRSWMKYQIACLMKNPDLPEACLPLRLQKNGRELIIRLIVEVEGSGYLLLLTEQTQSSLQSLILLGLSQRETEVLALVIQGSDNKAITSQLSIHISTVRKHLEHIYAKWGVGSRTEAISHALSKLGLF
jgi:DNA-binding CsgD family transcriptional regulator